MTNNDKSSRPGGPVEVEDDSKPSRIRYSLDTLQGVIKETCKVYREMRADEMDHAKGRSLVWVLAQLRAALETQTLERLEQRLEELTPQSEGTRRGYTSSDRPSRSAH